MNKMYNLGLFFNIVFVIFCFLGLVRLNNIFLLAFLLLFFFFILFLGISEYIKNVLKEKIMKIYKRYLYLLNLLSVKIKFVKNTLENALKKKVNLYKIYSVVFLKRKFYTFYTLDEVVVEGLKKVKLNG